MDFKRKLVVAGLIALLTFGVAAPVYAVPSQADLDAAGARLAELGDELAEFEAKLSKQGEDLEKTQYEIGETQKDIDKTEVELEAARSVLSHRMRSGYKTGLSSLVDVLFNATSFEDLVSRIYYMDKISQADADAISVVQDLEDKLNSQMDELKKEESSLEKQMEETNSQVEEYEAKVAEAQDYYNSLDRQIQEELARQAAEEQARREAEAAAAAAAEEAARQAQQNENAGGVATAVNTVTPAETPSASDDSKSASGGTSMASGGGGLSSAYAAVGSPYVYGAAGPSSFDCSGLVCFCYGYGRGRTTYAMISSLQSTGSWKTSMSELSAGDLVFTHPGHVGIYVGGGQMVHAPSPGRSVCVAPVYAFYGGGTF